MIIETAEYIANVVAALLPVGALVIALVVGYSAAKINRKNKMVDVAMHCITRYDVIAHDRALITSREQALGYYRRFFGLKSDQFDYWLSGLIDAENMASWTYATLNGFEQDKKVCYLVDGVEECVSLREGFVESLSVHDAPNATFVRFMEKIQALAKENLTPKEKYYELIRLLERTEDAERDFIRFADVNFAFMRLRGGDMRAFRKMEARHHKRVESLNGSA
jgi:hypothetical protein